jgi:hypothetical protein
MGVLLGLTQQESEVDSSHSKPATDPMSDFDTLTRDVANGLSRRQLLLRLFGILASTTLGSFALRKPAWAAVETCNQKRVDQCLNDQWWHGWTVLAQECSDPLFFISGGYVEADEEGHVVVHAALHLLECADMADETQRPAIENCKKDSCTSGVCKGGICCDASFVNCGGVCCPTNECVGGKCLTGPRPCEGKCGDLACTKAGQCAPCTGFDSGECGSGKACDSNTGLCRKVCIVGDSCGRPDMKCCPDGDGGGLNLGLCTVLSEPKNCGACGKECPAGANCLGGENGWDCFCSDGKPPVNGKCKDECRGEGEFCAGGNRCCPDSKGVYRCVPIVPNCHACGVPCAPGEQCDTVKGKCVEAGASPCWEDNEWQHSYECAALHPEFEAPRCCRQPDGRKTCVDANDINNCGQCGNSCTNNPSATNCRGGIAPCPRCGTVDEGTKVCTQCPPGADVCGPGPGSLPDHPFCCPLSAGGTCCAMLYKSVCCAPGMVCCLGFGCYPREGPKPC